MTRNLPFIFSIIFLLTGCKESAETPTTDNLIALRIAGTATDISVGANGTIYSTGSEEVSVSGGYSIRKLINGLWVDVKECAAIRIAVAPDGTPWVVNKSKLIFKKDPGSTYWTQIPGQATDIGVGADGSVFIVANDNISATGGHSIKKWDGSSWSTLPDCAGIRIAVDPNGTPWVINKSNLVLKYNASAGSWTQLPGKGTDIGIGANGTVFITGISLVPDGSFGIFKWSGSNWTEIEGIGGINISVSPQGSPYWVNKANAIFSL